MKEHNGYKYSKESFETYNTRVRVELKVTRVINHKVVVTEHSFDIYTDNVIIKDIKNDLWELSSENVTSLDIAWSATREEDEATAKFIEKFLK